MGLQLYYRAGVSVMMDSGNTRPDRQRLIAQDVVLNWVSSQHDNRLDSAIPKVASEGSLGDFQQPQGLFGFGAGKAQSICRWSGLVSAFIWAYPDPRNLLSCLLGLDFCRRELSFMAVAG
jgi:hypothetical protein